MFVRPYQSVRLLMINKKLNTGTVDIMFQIKTITENYGEYNLCIVLYTYIYLLLTNITDLWFTQQREERLLNVPWNSYVK